jgi:hypothetical protein
MRRICGKPQIIFDSAVFLYMCFENT